MADNFDDIDDIESEVGSTKKKGSIVTKIFSPFKKIFGFIPKLFGFLKPKKKPRLKLKFSKKLFIWSTVGLLSLLILSGGGYFAYMKWFAVKKTNGMNATSGEETPQVKKNPVAKVVTLKPFQIVLKSDREIDTLHAELNIEVENEENKGTVTDGLPDIRDLVQKYFEVRTFNDVWDPEDKLQIKIDLMRLITRKYKNIRIKNIYFSTFYVK